MCFVLFEQMLQLFLYRPSDVEEAGGVLPADMGPKEVFLAVPLRRTENVYSDNLVSLSFPEWLGGQSWRHAHKKLLNAVHRRFVG